MTNRNDTIVSKPFDENEITRLLESFRPAPSQNFYHRMEKSPWSKRYRFTRLSLRAAVVVAVIFMVLLVNPPDANPIFYTNTPTSTATVNSDYPPNKDTTETAIGFVPTITPSK